MLNWIKDHIAGAAVTEESKLKVYAFIGRNPGANVRAIREGAHVQSRQVTDILLLGEEAGELTVAGGSHGSKLYTLRADGNQSAVPDGDPSSDTSVAVQEPVVSPIAEADQAVPEMNALPPNLGSALLRPGTQPLTVGGLGRQISDEVESQSETTQAIVEPVPSEPPTSTEPAVQETSDGSPAWLLDLKRQCKAAAEQAAAECLAQLESERRAQPPPSMWDIWEDPTAPVWRRWQVQLAGYVACFPSEDRARRCVVNTKAYFETQQASQDQSADTVNRTPTAR